jgi:hypothetical protein
MSCNNKNRQKLRKIQNQPLENVLLKTVWYVNPDPQANQAIPYLNYESKYNFFLLKGLSHELDWALMTYLFF